MRQIVLTYPNQVFFHLEKGEYVLYFIKDKGIDGYIKKMDSGYEVVAHPKYDNGSYVSDDVEDIQSVARNIFEMNAKVFVYPGSRMVMRPFSKWQTFKNVVMGLFFRNNRMINEIFREGG